MVHWTLQLNYLSLLVVDHPDTTVMVHRTLHLLAADHTDKTAMVHWTLQMSYLTLLLITLMQPPWFTGSYNTFM